ncbi:MULTISPECIES: aldose epimerase family protein [Clostridium]|uniref:Aldose 1-epimerase n=1 Tax=Clostridium disporicum TaxID=84024 RepID=A0A174CD59_9CLOT|nr:MULTISPECIES: aldose epimerase family protein [Clostridium]MCD2501362.1 galactose mutarotase [Clostridium sp. NSJ-145]CUO11104.1 aldose 1-epimerase Mro [Clostridium disporicum]
MRITKREFGITKEGIAVHEFKIENQIGEYITILDYGCTLTSINVLDKNENLVDVCLGYKTLEEYENNISYLGAIIGRHANRIKEGKFILNDTKYELAINNGPNHLHGGKKGFDRYVWDHIINGNSITFFRVSKHLEEGYPGNLSIEVKYEFNDEGELIISYYATTDRETIVNLTNHCYFNLNGENKGNILGHKLKLNASKYTENDEHCLPTGNILNVEESPFDFREGKKIGRDINDEDIQLKNGLGYDHNFILDSEENMKYVGELEGDESGIEMKIYTTCPGVQFYSGNVLDGENGKSNTVYNKRAGLCLETQYFPNSLECSNFPSVILKEGESFKEKTIYKFSTK